MNTSQENRVLVDAETNLFSRKAFYEDMFQFPNQYYMGVNIFILMLQFVSIFTNGFIIFLFLSTPRLRRNAALRLILLLCVTDFLFAITSIPYMINYVVYWDAIEFNYNGIRVIALSLPLTIQFKVNLIITSALALDRLQAIRFSLYYRQKNENAFVLQTLLIGVILSLIDCYLEFKMDPLPVNKGCAAVGCFLSLHFRWYWGASNIFLSFILLILTGLVARELKRLDKSHVSVTTQETIKSDGSIAQANRLTMTILVIAFIFQTIPSVLVAASDFFGLNSFQKLGPFYIVGLLLCGVFNSIVYITHHLEIQVAAKSVLRGVNGSSNTAVTVFTRNTPNVSTAR